MSLPWTAAFWADDPEWTNPGDGNPVSSWRDGGSEGKPATQGTGSMQPTYNASVPAFNGKATISGDGVDDFLQTANWSGVLAQPFSVFCVGNFSGTGMDMWDGNDATNSAYFRARSLNYRIHAGTIAQGGTPDTDPHYFLANYVGASSGLLIDGATIISADAGSNGIDGLSILANQGGGMPNGGHIAFIGVVPVTTWFGNAGFAPFGPWVEDYYGITQA